MGSTSSSAQGNDGTTSIAGYERDEEGKVEQQQQQPNHVLLPLLSSSAAAATKEMDAATWTRTLMDWYASTNSSTSTNSIHSSSQTSNSTSGRRSRNTNNNNNGKRNNNTNKRPADLSISIFPVKRMTLEQQSQVVQWSAGKASSSLRRQVRRKLEWSWITSSTSSWRTAVLGQIPYLLGDYRDDGSHPSATVPSDSATALDVLEAALAYAEAMIQAIEDTTTSKRVYHSQICQFLLHAARLTGSDDVDVDNGNKAVHQKLDTVMWALIDISRGAQQSQAKIYDLLFEAGVDVDALKKQLDHLDQNLKIELDEMEAWKSQIQTVSKWQERLDAIMKEREDDALLESTAADRDDFELLESFIAEAKVHGFRSKGLVTLEKKLQKAYQLRDRILEWKKSSAMAQESTKFLAALVRELSRLRLAFPEGNYTLVFHREVESWIDRANVAIRSRISLHEIKKLLERALQMPLNLSEYTEKLQARVDMAEDWLERFKLELSCDENAEMGNLEWMRQVRQVLADGVNPQLHELASEGSRMPVECDLVKIMQLEMDARSWSAKARKWIPTPSEENDSTSRRGKLDDLEEHVAKAASLRERLCLPDDEKDKWILDGEEELKAIVDEAHEWFDRHEEMLESDNRRNVELPQLSLEQLRQIVRENDAVFANLGNATIKVTRILGLAEAWYEQYSPLLRRCGLLGDDVVEGRVVSLTELKDAVDASASDLPIELEEATKLREVEDRIRNWFEDCAVLTGKSKKRTRRSKTFTLDRLKELIVESASLPVDTKEDVRGLEEQLASVNAWQMRTCSALEAILSGFTQLQEAVNSAYGEPSEFTRDTSKDQSELEEEDVDKMDVDGDVADEKKATDEAARSETPPGSDRDMYDSLVLLGIGGESSVHALIKTFCEEASNIYIETPEGDTASELQDVVQWFGRSLKYLESPRDIFDKRFFGAFDRFVAEGKTLIVLGSRTAPSGEDDINARLRLVWKDIVQDQLTRLGVILAERDRFVEFCKTVDQLLSAEKRESVEKLHEVAKEALNFPSDCDMVRKVFHLHKKMNAWRKETSIFLLAKGKDRMTMSDAKLVLDKGEKLGFTCDELKQLRSGIKAARSWAAQVKRCKVDDVSATASGIKKLSKEHDTLIVDMPEELARLSSVLCNYCICRRPFDGFMIACDTCDDWFHGSCIGVTESKAGKTEKYVCLRCSVVRTHKTSSTIVVSLIKKWVHDGERKKARQVDAQKLQRKIRKDTKDMAALELEKDQITKRLTCLEKLENKIDVVGSAMDISEFKNAEVLPAVTGEAIKLVEMTTQPMETSSQQALVPLSTQDVSGLVAEKSQQSGFPPIQEGTSLPEDSTAPSSTETCAAATQDSVTEAIPATNCSQSAEFKSPICKVTDTVIAQQETSIKAVPETAQPSNFIVSTIVQVGTVMAPQGAEVVSEATPQSTADSASSGSAEVGSVAMTQESGTEAIPKATQPAYLAASKSVKVDTVAPTQETATEAKSGEEVEWSKELCEARLAKINELVAFFRQRLDSFAEKAAERRNEEVLEDARATALKQWCLDVLSLALMPWCADQIEPSRPKRDGSLSEAMMNLVQQAESDNLIRFGDVKEIINAFKCMSWCIRASAVLARRPNDSEVDMLVNQGSDIAFPEDKAFRALKAMLLRAKNWDGRVKRALLPIPGEARPFNLDVLKDLSDVADAIPLNITIHNRLMTVIDDDGCRHCLCGGPSDGRFMLCCDKCNKWFHGVCVGISTMGADEWNCPACSDSAAATVDEKVVESFHDTFALEGANTDVADDESDDDVASKAPNAEDLWPPFGVLESVKAREALGTDMAPFTISSDGQITLGPRKAPPAPRPASDGPKPLPPLAATKKAKPATKPAPKAIPAAAKRSVAPSLAHAPHLPPPFAFPAPLSNQLMQNMLAWQQSAMIPMSMRVAPPHNNNSTSTGSAPMMDPLYLNSFVGAAAGDVDMMMTTTNHNGSSQQAPVLAPSTGRLGLDVLKKSATGGGTNDTSK